MAILGKNYILVLLGILLTAAILSYLSLALSIHMIADDYCMTHLAETRSISEFLYRYYTSWSGQFSYPFVKTFTHGLFGINATIVVPIMTYLIWWSGVIVLLRILLRKLKWKNSAGLAILIGSFLIFVILSTMASRQTMYWLDAVLFHVLPLALFVWIVIGWLVASVTTRYSMLKATVFGALLFMYAGMHILSSLFGIAFWVTIIALIWLAQLQTSATTYRIAFAALVGNLAGLFVVFLAPGNWQRFSTFEQSGANVSVLEGIIIASEAALRHWVSPFSLAHIALCILVMVAFCAIWQRKGWISFGHPVMRSLIKHPWLSVGCLLAIGIGYSAASLFIPAVSMGTTQTRVFVTAGYVKSIVSVFIGLISGLSLLRSESFSFSVTSLAWVGVTLLIIGTGYRISGNLELQSEYSAWSQEWNSRHTQLLEAANAGAQTVYVAPFEHTLPKLLGPNPDSLFTFPNCVENYYSIPSIEFDSELSSGEVIIVEP